MITANRARFMIDAIQHELDKELHRLAAGLKNEPQSPPLQLSQTESAIHIEMELPGRSPEEIQASILENVLSIRAPEALPPTDAQQRKSGRSRGAVHWETPLPFPADASTMTATLEHGVLTISIPKPPKAVPQTLKIKCPTDSSPTQSCS